MFCDALRWCECVNKYACIRKMLMQVNAFRLCVTLDTLHMWVSTKIRYKFGRFGTVCINLAVALTTTAAAVRCINNNETDWMGFIHFCNRFNSLTNLLFPTVFESMVIIKPAINIKDKDSAEFPYQIESNRTASATARMVATLNVFIAIFHYLASGEKRNGLQSRKYRLIKWKSMSVSLTTLLLQCTCVWLCVRLLISNVLLLLCMHCICRVQMDICIHSLTIDKICFLCPFR